MSNINFKHAIMHILDTNHDNVIISVKELNYDSDTMDFLDKHMQRVINDGGLKKAYFKPGDNELIGLFQKLNSNADSFAELSEQLAARVFKTMQENPCIPAGDIVFAIYTIEDVSYFALIKFNYKHSYIHYVVNTDEGSVNTIVKQRTTLPGDTQRVEECVIVNLANCELEILEKPFEICGEKEYYLSKYIFKCDTSLSNAEKLKILDKAVAKISKKHQEDNFDKVSKLRSCVSESLSESNRINVDNVAEMVFHENTHIKEEYIQEIRKAGLIEPVIEIPPTEKTGKKFQSQRLKTDSGIEINVPSHMYQNKDLLEFINNPDGTISILIKNVGKIFNK
ncbi:MAG TPA: nucleoid-associated protein [Desulfobacteria bacterium]|nr:nucleoid-associated protein [Desulfobacteria bacterium]